MTEIQGKPTRVVIQVPCFLRKECWLSLISNKICVQASVLCLGPCWIMKP